MEIVAIYIGSEFYTESQTIMSSTMLEDGKRFSWAQLENELIKGNTVTVRPATDAELGRAYKMLKRVKKENAERRAKWAQEDAEGNGK